jgi:hypothetical protein
MRGLTFKVKERQGGFTTDRQGAGAGSPLLGGGTNGHLTYRTGPSFPGYLDSHKLLFLQFEITEMDEGSGMRRKK